MLIETLGKIEEPKWLRSNDFSFSLNNILKDSLYYPACGFDGSMVKNFKGRAYSFIYVDANVTFENLEKELIEYPFLGCRIIHRESINPQMILPNIDNYKIKAKDLVDHSANHFCEWFVFENDEKERFSMLYIVAEAIATYHELYIKNRIAPIAIGFNHVDGFSGNRKPFLNNKGGRILLEDVVMSQFERPKYLITFIEHSWKEYQTLIGEDQHFFVYTRNEVHRR